MRKFFKDLFTGRDNHTYDVGRVLWFQAIQAFIAISIYAIYQGGSFDAVTWGAGLAALLGGGGAAIGLKSTTEPDDLNGDGYVDEVEKAKARSKRMQSLAKDDTDQTS
jgi:hypothetical protein